MNNYLNNINSDARTQDKDFKLIRDFLLYLNAFEAKSEDKEKEGKILRLADHLDKQTISMANFRISHYRSKIEMMEEAFLTNASTEKKKSSFLVFKNQKYKTVETKDIAFFHITNDSAAIRCFDNQEFTLNKSLDNITHVVSPDQFFRVNRKFLINFRAIKEVEHYFLRKLFVKLVIETPEQILINKEKTQNFLSWMENR